MPPRAILADMNIAPATVERLRADGWVAIRSSEVMPVTATDEQLLEYARAHDLCVLTSDLDFSALLALGGHRLPSVLSLRLSYGDPDLVADRVLDLLPQLQGDLAAGCIATVEDGRVRVRDLPIGRGDD